MITKQDFDRKNRNIAKHNAGIRQLKVTAIIMSVLLTAIFLCVGSTLRNVFTPFFILTILVIIVLILILRIKYTPTITLEQFAHTRAAQKFRIQQIETQYAVRNDSLGTQTRDTRYISDQLRRAVLARDNYKCRSCNSNAYLELDHIIPHSKGGATSYENLQVLCRSCNQRKGAS